MHSQGMPSQGIAVILSCVPTHRSPASTRSRRHRKFPHKEKTATAEFLMPRQYYCIESVNLCSQGMPSQGMPSQGMPSQGMLSQRMPSQGMLRQGMTSQEMLSQGMPNQGMPSQGKPSKGMPSRLDMNWYTCIALTTPIKIID